MMKPLSKRKKLREQQPRRRRHQPKIRKAKRKMVKRRRRALVEASHPTSLNLRIWFAQRDLRHVKATLWSWRASRPISPASS